MKHFGLLGRRLGHSFSPRIHKELGEYEYRLYEKEPFELDAFLRGGAFDGLNVTIPYKEAVLPYCSQLSDCARAVGSVNTLIRQKDGTLLGDNTDYCGFEAMLRQADTDVRGKNVLVLGSGGASKTVQAVLKKVGAEVSVVSRSGRLNYENVYRQPDVRMIVNTTPVGMYPENGRAPLCIGRFPACEALFDLIYNPARTRLMLDAMDRKIPVLGGLCMLVEQAAAASALFTGREVPPGETRDLLRRLSRETENIVLIGMPGCGKTTTGRMLAQLLGRPFYDVDEEIVRRQGMSIPEIFARFGEDAFRTMETRATARLSAQSGAVIASGGGVVERRENRDLLRQNSVVVWIRRSLGELSSDGRPVSQSRPVADIAAKRLPLYERWSDISVAACGALATAQQIRKELTL